MADYAPPPGPPPPSVPEGWKAQWNEKYKEWFYVNIYTKKSQWEVPTRPAHPSGSDSPPPGAPPGYSGDSSHNFSDTKSNNPFNTPTSGVGGSASPNSIEDDARLAAKLQAEEAERARSRSRGSGMSDYASTPLPPQAYGSAELPPREQKKGFFSRLMGSSHSQPYNQAHGGGYVSPPPQGYGGYPQQYPPVGGYGGYPPPQGYGAYPPQGYGYAQQPPGRAGGGLGAAGGAALGLGGGLIGGMLLADAIGDHDQSVYQQGYEQGEANADGGDYGGDGGDMGGGDF